MGEVWPFVLCGGAGTRLWPLSREAFPKQFHRIAGNETLLQQTCKRLIGRLFFEPTVLSSKNYRFLVAEQLEDVGLSSVGIVLEPIGRNTAPAACIAALMAKRRDPEALVLLAPSDHMISDTAAFSKAVASGIAAARSGALVTFGVKPDCAHTGYGYIEVEHGNSADLNVLRFQEKPSAEQAQHYLDSGTFYWNAGIFLFSASALIELFEVHSTDILEICRRALDESVDDQGFRVLDDSYAQSRAISLDYAIAEKTTNMRCVPLGCSWSDVGSWSALWDFLDRDPRGNVVQGSGSVILEETTDSYVYSEHGCVAVVGMEDVIVVAMEDAVLVASKEQAEAIKKVVSHLKNNGHSQALQHNRVYRPWGWYQGLTRGDRYQVKCIMVKPKATLSLQSHHHRSEHWVVVTGTVEVTRGDEVTLLSENQSTYIPIGHKHRLANPGKIPAFLIEVQSGPYLDEDDIVRYADMYGRDSGQ